MGSSRTPARASPSGTFTIYAALSRAYSALTPSIPASPLSLYLPVRHMSGRPALQGMHSPHPRLMVNEARSPALTLVTTLPVSITLPMFSCPMTKSFKPSGGFALPSAILCVFFFRVALVRRARSFAHPPRGRGVEVIRLPPRYTPLSSPTGHEG